MNNAKKIIELVKKIAQHHPGQEPGQKLGWSWYTGGMADTGGWDTLKLLDQSEQDLEKCLAELEEIANRPPHVYTPEELAKINTPTIHHLSCGGVVYSNAYQDELITNRAKKLETALLWGK